MAVNRYHRKRGRELVVNFMDVLVQKFRVQKPVYVVEGDFVDPIIHDELV